MQWVKKQTGFTIVELLIVIVVIAILAAITIVSYTGIQNRANDTSVQSDLTAVYKLFELYKVDNGTYPKTATDLNAMSQPITVSKGAYTAGGTYNFTFCPKDGAWDGSAYGIAAQSKSGNAYYITSSTGGVRSFSGWGTSVTTICPAMGYSTAGIWGYTGNTQTWQTWVKG
mgnify:FL=1|tara:strand:+ start:258 stop:770 length:513 start_codon:yes stop_codon:yes gene_type:complete